MVLKEFDPKLMKFLYFLATHQKKMNSTEASREAKKECWDLSDRTIRRWFEYLNDEKDINYFMNLKNEQLNVVPVYILTNRIKNEKVFQIIPHQLYHVKGVDLDCFRHIALVEYHIPSDKIELFKNFWKQAKRDNLVGDCLILPHRTSVVFYSPFDKVTDKTGFIGFDKDYKTSNYFMELYQKINRQKPKTILSKDIHDHPLVIPLIYSSFGENFSSKKIWNSLKKRSETIWDFVPKKLLRKGKKDGVAIKYIQEVLKVIDEHKDELFQQIRVSYRPFYYGRHNGYYLLLKLKNENVLDLLITELHKRTLQLQYMPPLHKKEHLFYLITNENKFLEIMHDILPKFVDTSYDNKVILQDLRDIKNTYGKVDWTMFDPVKKEWIYEHEKYMKELEKLAKEVRTKQPLKEP